MPEVLPGVQDVDEKQFQLKGVIDIIYVLVYFLRLTTTYTKRHFHTFVLAAHLRSFSNDLTIYTRAIQ